MFDESQFIQPEMKARPFVRLVDYSAEKPEGELDHNISRHNIDIFDSEGTVIGNIKLKIEPSDKPGQQNASIYEITLKSDFIGKGFGKAAYLEILKSLKNIPLLSADLNDNSTKIWQSLVRDGLAQEELKKTQEGQNITSYRSIPEAVQQYFENNQTP